MRMGDVARFARARPLPQQAGALAGLALLASAPFGGLSVVPEPGAGSWTTGTPFEVGPFEVTVDRAVSTDDLGAAVPPPAEGNRLVAVVADVENVSDRMAYLSLLTDAVRPAASGTVDGGNDPFARGPAPEVYLVKDTSTPTLLNPDVALRVVLVWEQNPGAAADPGTLRLDVGGYDFVEEGSLTLDSNFWLPDAGVALSGEVAVEPVEDDA
ncbi:hypothetical protein SAMN04489844_3061 [Nocardioides exalbidus]|uniref:DUF4352 domain-containing protein n=1 Tax=Nocardioides exalbidus TaxID=402596 RepID=A0A1H4VMK7_9ACTN|nr:hypothetical protein [Nocardioides exalbidus]SEC82352.1 hypothetical protein SAMN04489844_3061 [Nocardioides exalbidus]